MNCAVIDLGTNTCNIVVARIGDTERPEVFYRASLPVRLGKGGINRNTILPDAIERAVGVLKTHIETCRKFGVSQVVTIATSAVRSADNAAEVSDILAAETGAKLNIISGEEEAQLIFEGVSLAVDFSQQTQLILDIGGGSNELILAGPQGQLWKQSFNLGVARIVEQFPISDPITVAERTAIETHFDTNLQALWEACHVHKPCSLVGCAGAFNTLSDVILENQPETVFHERFEVSRTRFEAFHAQMMQATVDERIHTPGLAPLRVHMIIPASILINLILTKLNLSHITATGYALREGALMRLHQNLHRFNMQHLNF